MTPDDAKRSRPHLVAYLLVCAVSVALLSAWVIGPDVEDWSAMQYRPRNEIPTISWTNVGEPATYSSIEQALSDSVRIKLPVVSSMNSAFLVATGLPLTSPAVSGTLWPSFFPDSGLNTNLFFADEFTHPCTRNTVLMREGLVAFGVAIESASKPALIAIAPNKSSVMMNPADPRHNALMSCSTAGRKDLAELEAEFPFLVQVSENDIGQATSGVPFWTGDTHWKPSAAISLVNVARANLARWIPPSGLNHTTTEVVHRQDTLRMLSIAHTQVDNAALVLDTDVNLTEHATSTGLRYWSFAVPGADPEAHSATLIVDSFVYASGITAALASQFSSGYVVPWSSMSALGDLDATEVIFMESVERNSYFSLASLTDPHLLEYIARPVPERKG